MAQLAHTTAAPSPSMVQPLMIAAGFAAIFVGLANPHPADRRAELSLQAEEHQLVNADMRAGFADAAGALGAVSGTGIQ